MSGEPYSKSKQLARGERRYRRKVASPKQWQAIIAAKLGPCRICCRPYTNGATPPRMGRYRVTFHHLIPRDQFGDDVAENIIPLCFDCHSELHRGRRGEIRILLSSLTDAEYAYATDKAGEGWQERIYGVTCEQEQKP